MPERLSERDLERTLSDIGPRLEGPTRDMWPAVRTRIADRQAQPWWSRLGAFGRLALPSHLNKSFLDPGLRPLLCCWRFR